MSVQISAYIEDDIKEKMERYAVSHGLKKGYLIENALSYYLDALDAVPQSQIVPGSLSISEGELNKLLEQEDHTPTQALKVLMRDA